jgi:hypothetical protein
MTKDGMAMIELHLLRGPGCWYVSEVGYKILTVKSLASVTPPNKLHRELILQEKVRVEWGQVSRETRPHQEADSPV